MSSAAQKRKVFWFFLIAFSLFTSLLSAPSPVFAQSDGLTADWDDGAAELDCYDDDDDDDDDDCYPLNESNCSTASASATSTDIDIDLGTQITTSVSDARIALLRISGDG